MDRSTQESKKVSNIISFRRSYKEDQDFRRSLAHAKSIISSLQSSSRFSVPTAETWKVKTYYEIQDIITHSPKELPSCFIYEGDFNNLKTANMTLKNGEKDANIHIENMLTQMEMIFSSVKEHHPSFRYSFGKSDTGDEVYISAYGLSQEESVSILNQLNAIKSGILSISFGCTNHLSSGLQPALQEVDQNMYQVKQEKKKQLRQNLLGENIEKCFGIVYDTILSRLRLTISDLSAEQRSVLYTNLKKSQEMLSSTEMVENIQQSITSSPKAEDSLDSDDHIIFQRINYFTENYLSHANNPNPQEMQDYVLSQILLNHPIVGFQHRYYLNYLTKLDNRIGKLPAPIASFVKRQIFRNLSIGAIELSKIKYVNDTYGHKECDKQVSKVMKSNICPFLATSHLSFIHMPGFPIKDVSDHITGEGISTFYFLVKEAKKEKLDSLIRAFSHKQNKTDLLYSVSFHKFSSQEVSNASLSDTFSHTRTLLKTQNMKKNNDQKIRDTHFIQEITLSVLSDIYYSKEFEQYAASHQKTKDEILTTILQTRFQSNFEEASPSFVTKSAKAHTPSLNKEEDEKS